MGKIKVTIHPLFIIFGIYFAFTGKVYSFIVFSLSALLHEFGHYCVSEKLGYKLKKIQLMPYGAVISGDLSDLKLTDEIKVALAGPIVSLMVGLGFLAVWWIFPDLYGYTETVAVANFSLAVINVIPAYPLDGGRVLLAFLSKKMRRKKAVLICRLVAVLVFLAFVTLFIFSVSKNQINYSLIIFGLFLLAGAFSKSEQNVYVKMYGQFKKERIKSGTIIKKIAVTEQTTIKDLLAIINCDCLYEVAVIGADGKIIKTIEPISLINTLSEKSIYSNLL